MYFKLVSPVTSAEMRDMHQRGTGYINEVNVRIHVLINVQELKSLMPESLRLDSYRELKNRNIGKTAIVGAHPTLRAINNALTNVLNYKNLSFFASEEEALKWIRAAIEADKQRESKAS